MTGAKSWTLPITKILKCSTLQVGDLIGFRCHKCGSDGLVNGDTTGANAVSDQFTVISYKMQKNWKQENLTSASLHPTQSIHTSVISQVCTLISIKSIITLRLTILSNYSSLRRRSDVRLHGIITQHILYITTIYIYIKYKLLS